MDRRSCRLARSWAIWGRWVKAVRETAPWARTDKALPETCRASGAGGQHVNTTDSAVRITHIPTGIAVASQQERSQIKNRAIAWGMLKSRLYEAELKRREEKANAEAASKTEIGWGHQIRSYVLQPYQLVKDLRTGAQSGNPTGVLDGGIDPFIESALAQRLTGGAGVEVADLD